MCVYIYIYIYIYPWTLRDKPATGLKAHRFAVSECDVACVWDVLLGLFVSLGRLFEPWYGQVSLVACVWDVLLSLFVSLGHPFEPLYGHVEVREASRVSE